MSEKNLPPAAERLIFARERRKFATAAAACDFFGWNYDTYIQHERGERGITRAAAKYAKAYNVRESWLLTGEGPDTVHTVPVVGDVGAGELVALFPEHDAGVEPIEAPPEIGPNAVAVRVRGDSMYPELDPDDIIVYDRRYEANFDDFIGRRLVIGLVDGRQFVKRLRKGSLPGLYTLISSNPRERDIEDVELEWVAPIEWIRPSR